MNNGVKSRFLETLGKRPIIGDGSYVITLEKRGYVCAGSWTPECVLENPDAVKQLHTDFLRAGADVLQAFSFYATDGKLQSSENSKKYTSVAINNAACRIVQEVAGSKPDTFICGGISPTPTYTAGHGKTIVQQEFTNQVQVFSNANLDFLLGEFFISTEEACWAIESMKASGLPVACTIRIGPKGDCNNVPPGECALRMARAGADVLGINCQYDPTTCIETIKLMKEALDDAGLSPFLMLQPVGFHCPEIRLHTYGYHDLPEFPFALEPRLLTRYDARKYARDAYNAGVRYLGGCCGFEPYHIREMAAELAPERGFMFPGADKHREFGEGMKESTLSDAVRRRHGRKYWENIKPASGRPDSVALATPDA